MHSPMEQFEIKRLLHLNFGGFDASFTNSSLWMVITVVLATGVFVMGMRQRALVPQQFESELDALNARIVITNYHAFEPRVLSGNKRSPFDGKLDLKTGKKKEQKEDFNLVLRRVLGKRLRADDQQTAREVAAGQFLCEGDFE